MSMVGIPDSDKTHKKPFHRRNDSGELDVFEAARYFSGSTEVSGCNGATFTQKLVREERQGWRGGRISLDFAMRNSIPSSQTNVMEKQVKEKKKSAKQPSSPGGRLASFLNSLFHQTPNSKKKKSKSTTTTQSVKDEDESPGGRRKRRSSISHFRSSSNTENSKSNVYSSSVSSGFRTPPSRLYYKDLRSYSDHKQVIMSLPKLDMSGHKDEKLKFTNGVSEKFIKSSGTGVSEKGLLEERGTVKFNGVDDDGGDSDSSSDLFELENYDLGYYSSGLPVYETTHMDNIKRGAPISNGAM